MENLLRVEIALLLIVLIGYPATVWYVRGRRPDQDTKLDHAMFMPQGTVRAMIALLVVGSFVNVLVLGSKMPHFDQVVAAFGGLTGAIIGFYFATRAAQTRPEDKKS